MQSEDAIIDDIKYDRDYIHSLLDKYSQQNHANYKVEEFYNSEDFLLSFERVNTTLF